MRFLVVLALVAANALLIYIVGSDYGLMSSLVTFFVVAAFLAWSFGRDGVWSGPEDRSDPPFEGPRPDEFNLTQLPGGHPSRKELSERRFGRPHR